MEFELVIFDCDGVLVDSEVISAQVLVELAAEAEVQIDLPYVARNFLGRSFPTVAQIIREHFGRELPSGFEADYRARLLRRFESELRPTPGIVPLLGRLAVPACVATSSSPPRAARSLELAGLNSLLPRVFTASLVSRGKPAPDLFLHAAAVMRADPRRCLVVEDSRPGLKAARAAGMEVVLYTGGSHMNGQGFEFDPPVRNIASWSEFQTSYPGLLHPLVHERTP